jgi:hypothetical protein
VLTSSRGAAVVETVHYRGPIWPGLLAVGAAGLLGLVVAAGPQLDRLLLAGTITAAVALLAIVRPRASVLAVFVFLPFMAMIRRLLIPIAGWTSLDPLLLVGSALAVILIVRLFVVEQRTLLTDPLSKLVAALLAVAVIQTANPEGGGIFVGLGGLLFMAAPLLWFFIGRALADRSLVVAVMRIIAVAAIAIAAYGLYQTNVGFPSWDRDWVNIVAGPGTHNSSLYVGRSLRPFGTLSSASEYLMLLGVGMAICAAFASRARYLLLAIPFLGVALFLGSGRGTFVLACVALVTIFALSALRGRFALLAIGTALFATIGALLLLGPVFNRPATNSTNPLIAHQASGLGHPLNEQDSTLLVHWRAFLKGVTDGVSHPLGRGTGTTTIAADRLSGSSRGTASGTVTVAYGEGTQSIRGTDVDLSNIFYSLGLVGGLLYATIFVVAGYRLIRASRKNRDLAILGAIGIAIATLGQWLSGGHYALAPLLWFTLGWATRPSACEKPYPFPAAALRESSHARAA